VLANQFVPLNGDALHVLSYAVLGCAVVALLRLPASRPSGTSGTAA